MAIDYAQLLPKQVVSDRQYVLDEAAVVGLRGGGRRQHRDTLDRASDGLWPP